VVLGESEMELSWEQLLRLGGLLIGIGFLVLVVFIPLFSWAIGSETKTEFYSGRAAHWCVAAGLLILALTAVGAIVQKVAIALKGH
jgi:hypothetical protein